MFKHICLGGTFDHLHIGHKNFLKKAFENSEKVTIGLTTKSLLLHKKYEQIIEPYDNRKKLLIDFLDKSGWNNKYNIIPLTNIYGNATTDSSLEAIMVTSESLKNARLINEKRIKNNLKSLKILQVEFVKSNNKIIRSEKIRAGIMDKDGQNYESFFKKGHNFKLPQDLRKELRKPLGKVFSGSENTISDTTKNITKYINSYPESLIIAVGDVICNSLKTFELNTKINIIDNKNIRKPFPNTIKSCLKARNPAGQIRYSAVSKLKKLIKNIDSENQQTLEIIGEEDLMVLPAVLLSPLGSFVIYGQKDLGVVLVEITLETKEYIFNLTQRFENITKL